MGGPGHRINVTGINRMDAAGVPSRPADNDLKTRKRTKGHRGLATIFRPARELAATALMGH
jgi:hypothetical protein